ncbi:MAG: hypothetical protein FJZ87_15965 [Chloroflexi bacterium]|nr:hypothetical protein [Chloroflexota bacterium]
MTEKTSTHTTFKDRIPQEARDHMRNAREEMRRGIEALFPEGFMKHRRGAQREVLLAFRSMIDSVLEKMETASK